VFRGDHLPSSPQALRPSNTGRDAATRPPPPDSGAVQEWLRQGPRHRLAHLNGIRVSTIALLG